MLNLYARPGQAGITAAKNRAWPRLILAGHNTLKSTAGQFPADSQLRVSSQKLSCLFDTFLDRVDACHFGVATHHFYIPPFLAKLRGASFRTPVKMTRSRHPTSRTINI